MGVVTILEFSLLGLLGYCVVGWAAFVVGVAWSGNKEGSWMWLIPALFWPIAIVVVAFIIGFKLPCRGIGWATIKSIKKLNPKFERMEE